MRSSVTTPLSVPLLVSMSGASPVTITSSWRSPTGSEVDHGLAPDRQLDAAAHAMLTPAAPRGPRAARPAG
jgi:hypothetical protein